MSRSRDIADLGDNNLDEIVVDGSGNVGIGTSSPKPSSSNTSQLQIADGTPLFITAESGGDARSTISSNAYKDGTNFTTGWNYANSTEAPFQLAFLDDNFVIRNAPIGTEDTAITWSEAMRIDSSGSLHIGKTATNFTVAGTTLKGDGTTQFTRDGDQVALFNRLTSDGTIIDLRKDNTTVGSIGVNSGTKLYFGAEDAAVRFDPDNNALRPHNASNDTATDATLNIGVSTNRFKDLYLSGGVYLGGTTSANFLDDYEEGTFTPAWSTGTATYTIQLGRYVKVGKLVRYQINLQSSSVSGMTTANITGLPFTSQNIATEFSVGSSFPILGFEDLGSAGIAPQITSNSTEVKLYIVSQGSSTNYTQLTNAYLNEGSSVEIGVSGFYYVD